MKLILVESPAKSKTLKQFLGKDYQVAATMGHIRDLPKSELGVDVENNFNPRYVIPTRARKTITLLKKEAKKAEEIILAADKDREGEAIAWHLVKALQLEKEKKPYQRITFQEITRQAIKKALENPKKIDLNLVDAQQARRILDRIVGYKLSPFLWKKIARGLSAGRVQSVALRFVADREKEIEEFVKQEYWQISSELQKKDGSGQKQSLAGNKPFLAELIKKNGKALEKLEIKNKKEADKILQDLEGAEYRVEKIEKKETKRNPLPPFITSTLQQTGWQKFRFTAKKTMRIAQQLYEKGFISYHRSDSLSLSDSSLFSAKKFILENYGKEYWAGYLRRYKTRAKNAQEAHEAIRPTYPQKKPGALNLDSDQLKIYELIWKRFIASQMNQAVFDSLAIEIKAGEYLFKARGQTLKFDGFLKVYPLKFEEKELPELEKNEILELIKLIPLQHFTQPPPRYNEASLIKTLEENGIGRPSTYAPILSNIQEKNYIEKDEQKRFRPTEIGLAVNNILVLHFPEIVDVAFTAKMEESLDQVAEGKEEWAKIIKSFYQPFEKNLKQKYEEVSKKDITETPTEKKCLKCGSQLLIRLGKYGKFYACSNFPKCRYTESLEENNLKIECPKCKKGKIVEKRTKKRKIFYGCNQYPECDFALWDKPINEKCPKCNSLLVEAKKGTKCSSAECHKNEAKDDFQKKSSPKECVEK